MSTGTNDRLVAEVKAFVQQHPPPEMPEGAMLSGDDFQRLGFTPRALYPTVSTHDLAAAETALGFPLPPLLRRLYLEVTNGIAGFCYDIIGLVGGCPSGCGTLVETYRDFQRGGEFKGTPWKTGLLPFCHWGCTSYSCVDCTDAANHVFTYEDQSIWPEGYTLADFFQMWLEGEVTRSEVGVQTEAVETINPFTGEKSKIGRRRRKRPS